MSNLGISQADLDAANAALSDFVSRTPAFYNTEANCKALQKFLKKSGTPIEQWNLGAWVGAFWACGQSNAEFPLEPAPRPETREERAARLEARDRRDGDLQSNASLARPVETEREKARQLLKERSEHLAHEKQEAQFQREETARIKANENDMGCVPTIEQLVQRPMNEAEASAWASEPGRSTQQLRRFLHNRQEASRESVRRFYRAKASQ